MGDNLTKWLRYYIGDLLKLKGFWENLWELIYRMQYKFPVKWICYSAIKSSESISADAYFNSLLSMTGEWHLLHFIFF